MLQFQSLFAPALQTIERDIELTFFQKKVSRGSRLIATETLCPWKSFRGQLLEETVCLHLSLSLLNETPKYHSSRLKVVEDLQLSFDSYQNLVSR